MVSDKAKPLSLYAHKIVPVHQWSLPEFFLVDPSKLTDICQSKTKEKALIQWLL